MKGLVDELLELSDPETDKKIIKSFELKDHLCPEIFDGKDMKNCEVIELGERASLNT